MISTLFFIGDAIKEGFMGIILTLDTLIYSLVSSAFKVFMTIAGARLLSSEVYTDIANRIYVVVGVLMLFVLSYAILRAIIDPEQSTKGEFGPKMIKNVVIAVVGLAIAPFIFNLMYQAQGLILEQDILGKLFFRIENTEKVQTGGSISDGQNTVTFDSEINPDEYVKSIGGAVTATSLWQAFFFPAEDSGKTAEEIEADPSRYFVSGTVSGLACAGGVALSIFTGFNPLAIGATVAACASAYVTIGSAYDAYTSTNGKSITLQQAYAMASAGEGFGIFTVFLPNYIEDGEISYYFGISTIAGAFALYAFISFSIDMGIRAAKLAYLQIIAPVPLIMQVLPKFKENFNKYIKMVSSTFIEVFIRISVVYIVVYIICHLTDLFSSLSTWGANSELNSVEKMFAMAFLILGLIAFCRQAPKIIAESLHLGEGNMKLGIGKKLADGGLWTGGAIAESALRSGVQSYNEAKGRKAGLGTRASEAVRGFGRGLATGTMMNFGPGHKPAETYRQARDIAGNAANAVHDKQVDRLDLSEKHAAAVATLDKARQEEAKKLRDLSAAQTARDQALATYGLNSAEYDAAKAKYEEALKEYDNAVASTKAARQAEFAATTLGSMADNLQKRATAWSTGTVSTAKEEAAVKFGDSLDGLKGKLREEAYKKDTYGAKMLKEEYDRLKSQPIREYAEGWDEQSYNAEYRKRHSTFMADTALQNDISDFEAKKAQLMSARSALSVLEGQGLAAGNAQYDAAKAQLDSAKQTLDSARTALESKLSASGLAVLKDDKVVLDMSDIKVDMATAMAERTREVEALRVAMEAAADSWVHGQATKEGSNTNRDIQLFISENASYINDHQNDTIVVGYDGDEPIRKTIAEVISSGFGKEAVTTGKFHLTGADKTKFTSQTDIEIEYEGSKGKVMYKKEGTQYVPYDDKGQRITDPGYEIFNEQTLFEEIRRGVTAGKLKGASSKSAISKAADAGKQAATYTKTHELADKKLIQRQAQDNKGGKK